MSVDIAGGKAEAVYESKKDKELVVYFNTLKITLFRGGMEQALLNGRGLLQMQHLRTKEDSKSTEHIKSEGQSVLQVNSAAWFEGNTHDAFWDEIFFTGQTQNPKVRLTLTIDTETTAPNAHRPQISLPRPNLAKTTPMFTESPDTPRTSVSQAQQAPLQDTYTPLQRRRF
ncbi:hypothetical protein EV424DRAFT_1588595 [Suillus variegatus]|nr:hypothetical protein EV424DRAFT_1588595 [Suillus variegatus]